MFDEPEQRVAVEAVHEAAAALKLELRCVVTDPTHVHALVSWSDERDWRRLRESIRYTLTLRLN